ncbi:MAG: hypothetical protein LBJ64_01560 [Deltaproteobacteria bacterium]|jgi:hypothetical protein|nr:hypothetical protein [Deltaproteobacteria bacterium]
MFKDFFLSPGRWFCRERHRGKRKTVRGAKEVISGPVVPISVATWILVALAAFFLVMKLASPPVRTPPPAEPPDVAAARAEAARESPAPQAAGTAQGAAPAAAPQAAPPAVAQNAEAATPGAAPGSSTSAAGSLAVSLDGSGESATPAPTVPVNEAWLVIVESIPKRARAEAEQSMARHKRRGVDLELFDTDAYPLLRSGMWTLAQGPFDSKREADAAAAVIRPKVRDLMVRRGL